LKERKANAQRLADKQDEIERLKAELAKYQK
jgi:uncharacterized small protein (DUF1192 family)